MALDSYLADVGEPQQRAGAERISASEWMLKRGQIEGTVELLRQRADAGDPFAAMQLASLLVTQNRVDEAIAMLRQHADDPSAAMQLADLLVTQNRVDEAIAMLRQHADHPIAAARLATLLGESGQVGEAIAMLRQHADDPITAMRLAELLVDRGRVEEAIAMLRQHADDPITAMRLAELLVEHGRVGQAIAMLRQHAEAGDHSAARQLAELLVEHGRVEEAIAMQRQHDDDPIAAARLAEVLVQRDRTEEAIALLGQHAAAGDTSTAELIRELDIAVQQLTAASDHSAERVDLAERRAELARRIVELHADTDRPRRAARDVARTVTTSPTRHSSANPRILLDAAAQAGVLLRQIADELAVLSDDLVNRAPSPVGERLLRGCSRVAAELTQAAQQLWAALSDFRGADLRAAEDVAIKDLDGVRWSDGTAGAEPTWWPLPLVSTVRGCSKRVDGLAGVWEVDLRTGAFSGRR